MNNLRFFFIVVSLKVPMMTHINEDELRAAYNDVRADSSETQW